MNEYIVLELEDNSKYVVIDTFEYQSKEYFLVTRVLDEETIVDNKFNICIYNSDKNCFEKIENNEELEFMTLIFQKKLDKQKNIEEMLDKILFTEMEKLRIIDIRDYDYIFQKENGQILTKNIEFYKKQPKVNDCIFISKIILNENVLQYGIINDLNNINENEIIKVITENEEYYLQRYYG